MEALLALFPTVGFVIHAKISEMFAQGQLFFLFFFLTCRKRKCHRILRVLQGMCEAQAAKGEQKAELGSVLLLGHGAGCFSNGQKYNDF